MKAVQTRCPQRALQVLSEGRLAATIRSEPRCEAQRKDRQYWWLGGGERCQRRCDVRLVSGLTMLAGTVKLGQGHKLEAPRT